MKRKSEQTTLYMQGTHVYVERWFHSAKTCKGTLLFIHGFLSSSFSFRQLLPSMPAEYDLLCFDLPGFGRSGKEKTFCYDFKNYATLLTELMELYELNHVTLIGHSMGGQVALYTAKQTPERIDSLILLSASAYFHRVKKSMVYSSYVPFFSTLLYSWGRNRDCRPFIDQLMYKKNAVTNEMVLEYGRPLKERGFYDSLACLMRQREGDMSTEDLHSIKQRCLIIWGENDPLIPLSIGKKLSNDLHHATLTVLPETGHLVPEEQPKKTSQLIKRFIT